MRQSQQQSSGGDREMSFPVAGGEPLAGYHPPAGVFDEYLDGGAPRAAWAPFAGQLNRLGSAEFERRWSQAQRLIFENAVAYNANEDGARGRPWPLDPIPILLHQDQWQTIAEGLAQRARVLDLALRDLYGPQQLIRDGVIPQELLYSHPAYLLPLRRGFDSASDEEFGSMLTFYAADLARALDGSWWVVADHTEAPLGVGFALENRIVLSRMLPEMFRECRVRRLASFFASWRETLEEVGSQPVRNPRVAILSEGPGYPSYFEDAYLARYLGYTLVEDEDLAVRGNCLWLKTLKGLTPVDVLIRRPSTVSCDPLELGGESSAGVAGLLRAACEGAVTILNPLGSGLVEAPAFMAFLPRLCSALMNETLKLPGAATYWCGEPNSLDFVLQNLDRLEIGPAFQHNAAQSAEWARLPRETLVERIRSNPMAFVGRERVPGSSTPVWRNGCIDSARFVLRSFVIGDGKSHRVLDSAFARTVASAGEQQAGRRNETSKDVWVVSEEPVELLTLLPDDDAPLQLVRIGDELPSRVADDSFWLGRHIERADSKARLLRTIARRLTEERDEKELLELPGLLRALAVQGQIEPGYAVSELRKRLPHVDQTLTAQVLNRRQTGSLSFSVQQVFRSATRVRDRLSYDAWRILLRTTDVLKRTEDRSVDLTDLINVCDALIADLAAVGGLVIEGMTRTQFYRFLDIGRRIERGVQLVDLLNSCLVEGDPPNRELLEALLETADSLMTYRARYRANLKFNAVLDLLLADETNPRSLAFQIATLDRHVGKLPDGVEQSPQLPPEKRLTLTMLHDVRLADVPTFTEAYHLGAVEPLAELLEGMGRDLPALSEAISLRYLVHAGSPRHLSPF